MTKHDTTPEPEAISKPQGQSEPAWTWSNSYERAAGQPVTITYASQDKEAHLLTLHLEHDHFTGEAVIRIDNDECRDWRQDSWIKQWQRRASNGSRESEHVLLKLTRARGVLCRRTAPDVKHIELCGLTITPKPEHAHPFDLDQLQIKIPTQAPRPTDDADADADAETPADQDARIQHALSVAKQYGHVIEDTRRAEDIEADDLAKATQAAKETPEEAKKRHCTAPKTAWLTEPAGQGLVQLVQDLLAVTASVDPAQVDITVARTKRPRLRIRYSEGTSTRTITLDLDLDESLHNALATPPPTS